MPDFAPGIKSKTEHGEPARKLKPGQLVDYVVQKHDTKRKPGRPHLDLRLGSPETGLFSWAVPKGKLPKPGEKKLAPQTQVHDYEYRTYEGDIGKGYGAGHVRREDLGRAIITNTTPNTVSFTLADSRVPTRYSLIHMNTGNGKDWLLINRSARKVPGVGTKPDIKMIKAVDLPSAIEDAVEVQEKIDGASGIFRITPKGRVEAFSVRPSKVTGRPIEHTERMDLQSIRAPKELAGTVLRGELYGRNKGGKGKALPFAEVSGILNSAIARADEIKKAKNVRMMAALFGIEKYKGKDVSQLSKEEKDKMLKEITGALPKTRFHLPASAKTPEGKARLLEDIRKGKNPRTTEGIVLHTPEGKVLKYVHRPEKTVAVTGTFPGKGKRMSSVGGLTFDKGQVGSGLGDRELADIASDPEKYKGKKMRVAYKEELPSGKLRAPTFAGWEIDAPVQKAAQALPGPEAATSLRVKADKPGSALAAKAPAAKKLIRPKNLQSAMEAIKKPPVAPPQAGKIVKKAVIRHEGSKWVLYTKNGKKVLGKHDTEGEAKAQERAVQVSKHAQAPYTVDDLYRAIKAVETSGESNPFIRTRLSNTPGGSTAYGPVQLTGTLAADYAKRFPKIFTPKELTYLRKYQMQADLFRRFGNEPDKEYYDPIYDYGGKGDLGSTEKFRNQYRSTAKKIMSHMYEQAGSAPAFVERWRGKPRKAAPDYYDKVYRQLGYTPEQPGMEKQQANDGIKLQFIGKNGNVKAEISAEIADTPIKRRKGLSKRAELPQGRGMFFDKAGGYWMKDVNFPLDLMFLDKEGQVLEKKYMPTVQEPDPLRPVYVPSSKKAAHAVEVPAGWCNKNSIESGDKVQAGIGI